MKLVHEDWLHGGGEIGLENVTTLMQTAIGSSPYATAMAYDPGAAITAYENAVSTFFTYLLGIDDPTTNWSVLYNQALTSMGNPSGLTVTDASVADAALVGDITVVDITGVANAVVSNAPSVANVTVDDAIAVADAVVNNATDITDLTVPNITGVTDDEIISDVDAFSNQLDDEINSKVLPRFRRGMQDINAVVSSSFVIGESNIEAFRNRDVSRHASTLRVNAALKNADVKVSNMQKDIQVGISNKDRNLEISRANLSKDTTIATANLNKNIQLSTSNLSKNISIATANLNKDVQLSTANLSKDTTIATANLNKDLQVSTANLSKNTSIATANLDKNVKISTANLSKNVTIATANLDKNIKVEDIKIRETLEYERLYLNAANQMLTYTFQLLSSYDSYARLSIEANRIKIVANKEYTDRNMELDKEDALWDLSMFQYGANVMASISGAATVTKSTGGLSVAQSVMGGGLSGAAAGAMAGGPTGIGAVPGAIIGGVLGVASALL
jgi:uncharacterized Fe-S cluster-containing protein